MTKTLQTKRKILNLLKNRDMTLSEMSRELGLSPATVSQHLDELRSMDAVEKLGNEHFRKLKYYHAKETTTPILAKYALAAAIMVIVVAAFLSYNYKNQQIIGTPAYNGIPSTSIAQPTNVSTTLVQPPTSTSQGEPMCPMLFYDLRGSIAGYNGLSLYKLNTSYGNVSDYVLTGNSGQFMINETVKNVLKEPSGFQNTRSHYATLSAVSAGQSAGVYGQITGITLSYLPANFTISGNASADFNLVIASNASVKGTYWLRIDGPCGGGVRPVLLTIGKVPYNGTLNSTGPVQIA